MGTKLNTGDEFPRLSLNLLGGGRYTTGGAIDSNYAVILFYRGHW